MEDLKVNGLGVCKGEYDCTPSNSNDLPHSGWIRATGAGNIKYNTMRGEVLTRAFDAKEISICAVARVWATGTTATGIICYY